MELAEKLTELRKKKGLSRREVAEATGISENTYKKYEIPDGDKASVRPPYERLCILADFYGVTTDYLLGREPQLNPFADLNLPPESEKDVLAKYMSFPPEIRACLLDALRKLGAAADGETDEPEPEQPAAKSIAEDMADTVIKGEQMFSKAHTNKK